MSDPTPITDVAIKCTKVETTCMCRKCFKRRAYDIKVNPATGEAIPSAKRQAHNEKFKRNLDRNCTEQDVCCDGMHSPLCIANYTHKIRQSGAEKEHGLLVSKHAEEMAAIMAAGSSEEVVSALKIKQLEELVTLSRKHKNAKLKSQMTIDRTLGYPYSIEVEFDLSQTERINAVIKAGELIKSVSIDYFWSKIQAMIITETRKVTQKLFYDGMKPSLIEAKIRKVRSVMCRAALNVSLRETAPDVCLSFCRDEI